MAAITATAVQTGDTFDTATAARLTEAVATAILQIRRATRSSVEESTKLVAQEFGLRASRDGDAELGEAVTQFVYRVGEAFARQEAGE
jgi:hypothetical protein